MQQQDLSAASTPGVQKIRGGKPGVRRASLCRRTLQRNRNELGETIVNKTGRKRLPLQEKSTT
jgi:hypothetical protein